MIYFESYSFLPTDSPEDPLKFIYHSALLFNPFTSIRKVHHGETPQNVQAYLLTEYCVSGYIQSIISNWGEAPNL